VFDYARQLLRRDRGERDRIGDVWIEFCTDNVGTKDDQP